MSKQLIEATDSATRGRLMSVLSSQPVGAWDYDPLAKLREIKEMLATENIELRHELFDAVSGMSLRRDTSGGNS